MSNHHKGTKVYTSDEEVDLMEPVVNAEEAFKRNLCQWTISDDPTVLLGPEQMLASNIEDSNSVAVAIRDIFDKKIAQKIIRFFIYGFPEDCMPMVNKWLAILKVCRPRFSRLFLGNDPDEVTKFAEDKIEPFCQVLTTTQRTADWFTLRTFHLTATMASKILSMQSNEDDSTGIFMV